MSDRTKIEWAEASWTPIRARHRATGKVGWACVHCYAQRLNAYRGTGADYTVPALQDVALFLDETVLTQPLRWKRPRRIFVASMTDLFEERVPDEWIDRIFAVMALASQHIFLVLTKRAGRLHVYLEGNAAEWRMSEMPEARIGRLVEAMAVQRGENIGAPMWDAWWTWPLPNVWLGVSIEDQPRYRERWPWLRQTPAAVRFVSLQPLLGPIDLLDSPADGGTLPLPSWVIVGGESGGPLERSLVTKVHLPRLGYQTHDKSEWVPKPEALNWVRSIIGECQRAGIPVFFKQWGGPRPTSGGHLVDGKAYREFPTVAEGDA